MGKYKLSILKLDLGSTSEDSSSSIDVDDSVFCESHFSLVQHEVHCGAQTSVWVPSQINVQGCCKSISTMAVLAYAYSDLYAQETKRKFRCSKTILCYCTKLWASLLFFTISHREYHKQSFFNLWFLSLTSFSEWCDVVRFIHKHFIDVIVSSSTCGFYITWPDA